MAKCTNCYSCVKPITIDNQLYFVCGLCKIVYIRTDSKLIIVVDKYITDKVSEQKGWSL